MTRRTCQRMCSPLPRHGFGMQIGHCTAKSNHASASGLHVLASDYVHRYVHTPLGVDIDALNQNPGWTRPLRLCTMTPTSAWSMYALHWPCRPAAEGNVFIVLKQLLSCKNAHTLTQASQCFTDVLTLIHSELGREEPP